MTTPSTLSSKQSLNLRWRTAIISQAPPPVVLFLQQCRPTSPHSAANWGPRVQLPESMGVRSHSNRHRLFGSGLLPRTFLMDALKIQPLCQGVIYDDLAFMRCQVPHRVLSVNISLTVTTTLWRTLVLSPLHICRHKVDTPDARGGPICYEKPGLSSPFQ